MDLRAKRVLDYWFSDLDQVPSYFQRQSELWFNGGNEVDEFIRKNFEKDVYLAVEGKLDAWLETPKGCLASIILLDQFSLNLYREQPQSYRQSEMAIPIVEKVLKLGWDWTLTPAELLFLYLPLEHSEKLEDQERSVSLFKAME